MRFVFAGVMHHGMLLNVAVVASLRADVSLRAFL